MSEQKKLLDQRKKMKAAQPHFVVKESHNVGCVKKRWRLPRGRHSGVRQYHKGKPALPTPGYGSPKGVYGLHRLGLKMVNICSKTDLEKINPKTEGAVLSATLGTRKKLDLLKLAEEKKIVILNVKNVAESINVINSNFAKRKENKAKITAEKSKKKEEKKKKAADKEKKETEKKEEHKESTVAKETESVEEKLKQEKEEQHKEMEKIITKKQ